MSNLSEKSFNEHKNCSVGETVVAQDDKNNTYTGIVQDIKGATVYVLGENGRILEFRRLYDRKSNKKAIFLGIDGKNNSEKVDTQTETKNKNIDITSETYKLEFDKNIISFETEKEQRFIGNN